MTMKQRTTNKGFSVAGVACFADTFVQSGSLVLRMKFSAKTPRHRKPSKPLAVRLQMTTLQLKKRNLAIKIQLS